MEYFSKYETQNLKYKKKMYQRENLLIFDAPRYNFYNEQGKPILEGPPLVLQRSFEALVIRGYITKYYDAHLCRHPRFQLTEKSLNAFNTPARKKANEVPNEELPTLD